MKASKILSVLACVLILLGFLARVQLPVTVVATGANVTDSPVIQDFYINATGAGQICQFAFNLTDAPGLYNAIFYDNVTYTSNTTLALSGTVAWANFTDAMPNYDCIVAFQLWAFNNNTSLPATTGLRYVKIYTDINPVNIPPFISISQAIQTIDAKNNWTSVDPYAQVILSKYTATQLQSMIDNYSAASNWADVLEWAAICNKLWYNNVPSDVQTDIKYALGNFTMIGNSTIGCLPLTGNDSYSTPAFTVKSQWALYGYYFNNCSWIGSYQNNTKWNVTAAYNFFDTAVNYSLANVDPHSDTRGLPLWIYGSETGMTYTDRYYDEDADTIECYLIFAEILNVSDAMNKALNDWNYVVNTHWNTAHGYFQYTIGTQYYECEAPFFLEIISMLKYYYLLLGNWTDVLTDIGNRFLSSEWNSMQWIDCQTQATAYAVVHANSYSLYVGNDERRLQNTVGAWQALLQVYTQLNSTYQSNMDEMLTGNNSQMAAWQGLLTPDQASNGEGSGAGLFNRTADLFSWSSADNYYTFSNDPNATAWAEILLVMLGIVPGTTTLAFPLEELNYEYIYDIDPQTFQFNLVNRTITIPANGAGNMTFQFGESPVAYSFNQSGIWQLTFSNSWNIITNVQLFGSGSPVVPELLTFPILPIFIATTLLAVMACKKSSRPKHLEE